MREIVSRHAATARVRAGLVAALLAASLPCAAQRPRGLDLGGRLEVGGEGERYVRMLALADTLLGTSWTLAPIVGDAPRALVPGTGHPWAARFAGADSGAGARWLRPTVRAIVNTAFPDQHTPGPVWAGRGATLAAQAGLEASWGRVHLQLAPIAFIAQNAAFPLASNGQTGTLAYNDARFPLVIDYPQRFGDRAYGRVDAGTSSLDIGLWPIALGISTAPERWGPALEYPLVLGPGAGGFPHYYLGTARPLNVGIARVQLQLIGGSLPQSDYSPAAPGKTNRFASGAVVSVSPRGLDGLEIGFDRFFESDDRASLRRALVPLSLAKFSGSSPSPQENEAGENQTASAFFRWVVPKGGVEVYGEWYREDYSGTVRTFVLFPDDLSAFTLGFQRVLGTSPTSRRLLRFEIVNGELSAQARLGRGFATPNPPYLHTEVLQGHTLHGMLLGSPEAYGGAGWRASYDRYTAAGRTTFGVERMLRMDWRPTLAASPELVHPDVQYAVRGEWLRFAGTRDYTLSLQPAIDLNRYVQKGNDRFNLNAAVTVRGW